MPDLSSDISPERRKQARVPRLLQSEFDFLAAAYGALGSSTFRADGEPRATLHRAIAAGPERCHQVILERGTDELCAQLREAALALRASGSEYDARCLERFADYVACWTPTDPVRSVRR